MVTDSRLMLICICERRMSETLDSTTKANAPVSKRLAVMPRWYVNRRTCRYVVVANLNNRISNDRPIDTVGQEVHSCVSVYPWYHISASVCKHDAQPSGHKKYSTGQNDIRKLLIRKLRYRLWRYTEVKTVPKYDSDLA